MFTLTIYPEAEEQLSAYFSWYEAQRKGLGMEFLLSVEAAINFIEHNPMSLQKRIKNYRIGLIDRFPYGIKGNYRIGVIIRGNTVWSSRFGHRNLFYKKLFP